MSILISAFWGAVVFTVDAYAVWLLWGWHGVGVGFPAITIWRAAGLSALWNIFALHIRSDDAERFILAVDSAESEAYKKRAQRVGRWQRALWFVSVASVVWFGWIAKLLAQ